MNAYLCRELAFFFPGFGAPWVPGREAPIQKTFALIRPDVAQDHKGEHFAIDLAILGISFCM